MFRKSVIFYILIGALLPERSLFAEECKELSRVACELSQKCLWKESCTGKQCGPGHCMSDPTFAMNASKKELEKVKTRSRYRARTQKDVLILQQRTKVVKIPGEEPVLIEPKPVPIPLTANEQKVVVLKQTGKYLKCELGRHTLHTYMVQFINPKVQTYAGYAYDDFHGFPWRYYDREVLSADYSKDRLISFIASVGGNSLPKLAPYWKMTRKRCNGGYVLRGLDALLSIQCLTFTGWFKIDTFNNAPPIYPVSGPTLDEVLKMAIQNGWCD